MFIMGSVIDAYTVDESEDGILSRDELLDEVNCYDVIHYVHLTAFAYDNETGNLTLEIERKDIVNPDTQRDYLIYGTFEIMNIVMQHRDDIKYVRVYSPRTMIGTDGIKKDCLEYEAKVAVTKDLENVCWSELDETSYPKTILENTFDEVYFSPFLE